MSVKSIRTWFETRFFLKNRVSGSDSNHGLSLQKPVFSDETGFRRHASKIRAVTIWLVVATSLTFVASPACGQTPEALTPGTTVIRANEAISSVSAPEPAKSARPDLPASSKGLGNALTPEPTQVINSVKTVGLFALVSFAPAAVLMFTSFVRINIVLILLRQALGSPQVPGNQVLTALALLLTALVMRPVADEVYTKGVASYQAYQTGQATAAQAWDAATRPIKTFMLRQIERTNHHDYLWQLYDLAIPAEPGRVDPVYGEEFPLRVVAPAFLLSELSTAFVIGFYIYLPFLVIDLVVSAVLAAMGLLMLPPSLVALPLKLILFVLAGGWLLVPTMLLQSFAS